MRWLCYGSVAVLAAVLISPASGQDQPSPRPPAESRSPVVLDPVVVEDRRPTAHSRVGASSKTGTPIEDSPLNIQVVPREVIDEQGATTMERALRNVSGVREASGSTYGFFDRFTVRGLEQTFLYNGLPDGTTTNGYSRSMLGIESIEVLKGPGSSLFGSGAPGGTINIVRKRPDDVPAYAVQVEGGSFGTGGGLFELTGPTGLANLNYRLDGGHTRTDGFRDLKSERSELLQGYEWKPTKLDHTLFVTLDYQYIEAIADNDGIPFQGNRLLNVPLTNKYYTPFGNTEQEVARFGFGDQWHVSDTLTVNNRLSVLKRDLYLLRNAGGTVAANALTMTGRQLRQQDDDAVDLTYQLEPVWTFTTGSVGHKLLTGVEIQRRSLDVSRKTASLPNIANVFNPVLPESSLGALTFTPNFSREITAVYSGVYAHDQIDVTDRLKLRFGGRVDRFDTEVNDRLPNRVTSRDDVRYSWQTGAVYKLTHGIAPFIGASRSHLGILSGEVNDASNRPPESATQYEAGVRLSLPDDRAVATLAAFKVTRSDFLQTVGGETTPIGEQQTKGFDIDLTLKPAAGLRVIANYTYQEAELTNIPADPTALGKIPQGVPAHSANLWTSYEIQGGPLQYVGAGVGVSYRDLIYADDQNLKKVPSYVTGDALLFYRPPGIEASLGVLNISDAEYFRYGLSRGAFPGNPLTYAARLKIRF